MSGHVIELAGLSLELGGRAILKDINFSVARGSFIGVVGPNGAGKSSLLRCMGGLCRNFSGHAALDGTSLSAMSEKQIARRIAWVHQTSSSSFPFTVTEFAGLSRYPWHAPFEGLTQRDREIIGEALESAGVRDIASRQMSSLSGGERQRALIAAALAQETDILFLDEPMSFLDYRHQAETLQVVERINRERGMTVVMVTHDINSALHGADEIAALKDGRIAWRGPAREFAENAPLAAIFDTEFESFVLPGRAPYLAPRGLVL